MTKSIALEDEIKKKLDDFKLKYGFSNFSNLIHYLILLTTKFDEKELLNDTFEFRKKKLE